MMRMLLVVVVVMMLLLLKVRMRMRMMRMVVVVSVVVLLLINCTIGDVSVLLGRSRSAPGRRFRPDGRTRYRIGDGQVLLLPVVVVVMVLLFGRQRPIPPDRSGRNRLVVVTLVVVDGRLLLANGRR